MIYLDSCILVSALENLGPRGDRCREVIEVNPARLAISPLVVHECLVMPIRSQDVELADRFTVAFDRMKMLDLDLPAFVRAAELRATSPGLRTPDSLHLAAAQLAGCDALWTNDRRLSAVSRGLAVDIIGG